MTELAAFLPRTAFVEEEGVVGRSASPISRPATSSSPSRAPYRGRRRRPSRGVGRRSGHDHRRVVARRKEGGRSRLRGNAESDRIAGHQRRGHRARTTFGRIVTALERAAPRPRRSSVWPTVWPAGSWPWPHRGPRHRLRHARRTRGHLRRHRGGRMWCRCRHASGHPRRHRPGSERRIIVKGGVYMEALARSTPSCSTRPAR